MCLGLHAGHQCITRLYRVPGTGGGSRDPGAQCLPWRGSQFHGDKEVGGRTHTETGDGGGGRLPPADVAVAEGVLG